MDKWHSLGNNIVIGNMMMTTQSPEIAAAIVDYHNKNIAEKDKQIQQAQRVSEDRAKLIESVSELLGVGSFESCSTKILEDVGDRIQQELALRNSKATDGGDGTKDGDMSADEILQSNDIMGFAITAPSTKGAKQKPNNGFPFFRWNAHGPQVHTEFGILWAKNSQITQSAATAYNFLSDEYMRLSECVSELKASRRDVVPDCFCDFDSESFRTWLWESSGSKDGYMISEKQAGVILDVLRGESDPPIREQEHHIVEETYAVWKRVGDRVVTKSGLFIANVGSEAAANRVVEMHNALCAMFFTLLHYG